MDYIDHTNSRLYGVVLVRLQVNSELGILTAVTIAFALLADFLLLPPVLLAVDRE